LTYLKPLVKHLCGRPFAEGYQHGDGRYCGSVSDLRDSGGTGSSAIRAVAALDDQFRRAIYRFIRQARRPVTRVEAASHVGISSRLAAFHLDKLVDAGLLQVGERSRDAAAVGRPPRVYEPADTDITVSIPQREKDLLASILIEAVRTTTPGGQPIDVAKRVAGARGQRIGAEARARLRPGRLGAERALTAASSILSAYGFEPAMSATSCVRLYNCPFAPLSRQATDLVCGINHALLTGLLAGLESSNVRAVLQPATERCCVELHTAPAE
jgi:predicted ArsR family transcriptional regulator